MNFKYAGNFIFLFYFVMLCTTTNTAQNHASFLGLRSGLSIPIDGYAKTSLDGGSFTLPGFNVAAEGAWFFSPKLGVGASVGMNLHPVDVSALGRERVLADPFLNDVIIRSDPYLIITAMTGLYAQVPLYKKISLTGKVITGLLYGRTPYQLYKPDYYLLPDDYEEITSAQDWKWSWQAGLGLKYNLSECVGLTLDSEFSYDTLSFNFSTANGIREDQKNVAAINLALGFRINL